MVDNLKKVSVPNRQKIIMIIGMDKRYTELFIMKYVEGLSREQIAERLYIEPESVDKVVTKARKQFNRILSHEYELFSEQDKKYLNLIV